MIKNYLKCIMLIDDDEHDNFFHERAIHKINRETVVVAMTSGKNALEYLKSMEVNIKIPPDLIFLDLNMPDVDGWEFLSEFSRLGEEIKKRSVIMILTTSKNPNDKLRIKAWNFVAGFYNKPLTKEILEEIIIKYFRN
jgi:CheY-like chemotaxis protein